MRHDTPRSGIRWVLPALLPLILMLGAPQAVEARGKGEIVVAVLGAASDGRRLEAALEGAKAASVLLDPAARIEVADVGSDAATFLQAVKKVRRAKPAGWIVVPPAGSADAFWKAARRIDAPIYVVDGLAPDATLNRGNVWHLGPSPAAEAVFAADACVAPLAASRVLVVHTDDPRGRALATSFSGSLSRRRTLAGVVTWPEDEMGVEEVAASIGGYEADWIYAALGGRSAVSFARALAAQGEQRSCLFSDGNRAESLVALGGTALEGSVFVGGPDPELRGRLGEDFVAELDRREAPIDVHAARAFEATRRILAAVQAADSTRGSKVQVAARGLAEEPGVFGSLAFEPYGGVRLYPFTYWRVRRGSLEVWDDGSLPTPGCGPPLTFGCAAPAEVNARRGRLGYLTYGEGETRTIEQDLLEIGLSTGGEDPELDALVRAEILGRAIRIAHRLFRREPDGSAIPGYSWGMTFTVEEPPEDLPRSRIWTGIVAGDHPAAGGQVIGSGLVAIYSTFLKRTMYVQRKLDPPLSVADRPLLDGSQPWGADRTKDFRGEKIRCLLDGFASAVGLTLSHEFGHLCGCGHDTEHPTSIMNVVAGAGASWEDAVWIPSHQGGVTTALGIDVR